MKLLFAFLFFFIVCFSYGQEKIKKDTIGITFSFPWVNQYHYVDYQSITSKQKWGFFGLGAAIYYKKDKNKISLNFGYTESLNSAIGLVNYANAGVVSDIRSGYAELILHHQLCSQLNIIAGFNFSDYIFEFRDYTNGFYYFKKVDKTLGATIGLEYRFNKYFSVATFYRPALASFETDGIYRHVISVDMRIDWDVFKK